MTEAEDCNVSVQDHDNNAEPLFRPFVSDPYTQGRRGQLEPMMSRHASKLDDLLLQRGTVPASSENADAQNTLKLQPMNMPRQHAEQEASIDNVIDNNRSHPLFKENTRTGYQQIDASNESPSHDLSSEDGELPCMPTRMLNLRFWSLSEQISLINAVEKCLMQDKTWHSEDRWQHVFARMCSEGHDRRSVNKIKSKFSYLTKDYQSIQDWNANKSQPSYEELSSSQKKAKGLPFSFDKDVYKRMNHFYRVTKFDEIEKEEKMKNKGSKRRKGYVQRGVTLALRASPRFQNSRINPRNAKTRMNMQNGHENTEEPHTDEDDNDNVHNDDDKHEESRDEDTTELEDDDILAHDVNDCEESNSDHGNEDGEFRGNQDKETINKESTDGHGLKERRPSKKQKRTHTRGRRERQGKRMHPASFTGGEIPFENTHIGVDKEPRRAYDAPTENLMSRPSDSNKEDMMYNMVTAMSRAFVIHAECLRHVLMSKEK